MRLLVLAPTYPFPPTDGVQLRLNNMLARIPADWQLRLLCFDRVDSPTTSGLPAPLNGEITRVPAPRAPRPSRAAQLRQLLRPDPSIIWKFHSPDFTAAVSAACTGVDGVLAVGLQMSQYLAAVPPGIPTAVDAYNVETLILERLAATRTGHKRWYWRFEAAKLRRAERRLLERAGSVFAISDVDQSGMRQLAPRAKIQTVSMGIDVPSLRPPCPPSTTKPRFTFVAAFNWHVNEDAALWLCQEVWPKVRNRLPEAELFLVGREPSEAVRSLAVSGSVTVTGTVPDVRPHLWESSALLVPLRYGSGVRTKILEAFAAQRPIVSTSVGCEGLPVSDGDHLVIADTADAFAAACVQVASEPALSDRLVRSADRLIADLDQLATRQLRQAFADAFPVTPAAHAASTHAASTHAASRH